ncbi:MAG TPA: PEP-CTERM sorting domain-containing protein [Tepidisphaeraceae bacterium]|nr:PEP-CTERM sorting domain-containing protein [Tepidisphaeraceae bacterium]
MAFQSAVTDGTQDCLNQVISTVPDARYDVSFWVAMTASPGSQFGLNPEWDAGGAYDTTMGNTAFYFQPTNSPAVPYTYFSFIETASGSSTSVYFHGADATGAILLDNVSAVTAPLTWNNASGTGDGVAWDTTSQNWNYGAPTNYSDGDDVQFNDSNNGNYTVTLNGTVSPASVTFYNNAGNYTLGGTGGIAGTGALTLVGSSQVTISTANTYSGGTNVEVGTLVIAGASALPAGGALTIGTEGSTAAVRLATSHGAFALSDLTISGGSTLDLGSNAVTISYGATDPIATIEGYLTDGFNAGWAGGEISSSSVVSANASQTGLDYTVGYADGADGITSVPSGQIEILPTMAGDAKLQGNVVFGDFQILAQYFGQSNTTWDEGDFTYNGTTNFGDFQLLAQDFGANSSGLTAGEIASLNGFAAQFGDVLVPNTDGVGFQLISVPEPASAVLLAASGFGLLLARRRGRLRPASQE